MKIAGSWKPVMLAGAGLLALSMWTSPAAAQHICQGDAFRLCNEFIPDRGKVASCLFKNRRQLTPGCRAEMGGGKAKVTRKAKYKRHGKRSRRHRR
jgi:hypothetical protein